MERIKVICDSCRIGMHQCNGLAQVSPLPAEPQITILVRCGCSICRRHFQKLLHFDRVQRDYPSVVTWKQFEEHLKALHECEDSLASVRTNLKGRLDSCKKMGDTVYFYYLRDSQRKPIVTVCLLRLQTVRVVVRGLAICHPNDNPCKVLGKWKALNRAKDAVVSGEGELVDYSLEVENALEDVSAVNPDCDVFYRTADGIMVSQYRVEPLPFEQKMLDKPKK